jgi:Ca2+-binding EF-hand superfamily protein
MGQGQGRRHRLSHDEIDKLLHECGRGVGGSGFTTDNIVAMYRQFSRDFPSGYVTRDTFVRSFGQYFPEGDREFAGRLFRAHDVDGNDRVSFGEFVVSLYVAQHGTAEEKLRWAFRMYDVDGDGTVSQAELAGVLKAIYCLRGVKDAKYLSELNAGRIMTELDADRSHSLTLEEFIVAAGRCRSLTDLIDGRQ